MATILPSVLITGGAGFIGSTLVRQWLAHEPETVVNYDKLTYAGLPISLEEVQQHPRYRFVQGDIADGTLFSEVLEEYRPQTILHLAAESHVDRSIAEPSQFAKTNILGTCVLLEATTHYWQRLVENERTAFRFVLISTDEVFGDANPGERFRSGSSLRPNSPYAASKAAGEHLAHSFAHTYGLPVVTVNPTNNYGARQLPEKLVPKMILAAAAGKPLTLYGDGLQQRDWLHVDDCCRALRAAARRGIPGERYLVGSGNARPNREIAEAICDAVDAQLGMLGSGIARRGLITLVADRLGHDRRYAVDPTTANKQLDWRPGIGLTAGLTEAITWYLTEKVWVAAAWESLNNDSPAGK